MQLEVCESASKTGLVKWPIPNSQSLIPVTVNDRNSHIRNGHMAVTYVTASNGQKVDNIFLRPVFDADSRGDLRFRSFCRH